MNLGNGSWPMSSIRNRSRMIGAATLLCFSSTYADSGASAGAATEPAADSSGLEEIVVTEGRVLFVQKVAVSLLRRSIKGAVAGSG
jgi:hypothetical protein